MCNDNSTMEALRLQLAIPFAEKVAETAQNATYTRLREFITNLSNAVKNAAASGCHSYVIGYPCSPAVTDMVIKLFEHSGYEIFRNEEKQLLTISWAHFISWESVVTAYEESITREKELSERRKEEDYMKSILCDYSSLTPRQINACVKTLFTHENFTTVNEIRDAAMATPCGLNQIGGITPKTLGAIVGAFTALKVNESS